MRYAIAAKYVQRCLTFLASVPFTCSDYRMAHQLLEFSGVCCYFFYSCVRTEVHCLDKMIIARRSRSQVEESVVP